MAAVTHGKIDKKYITLKTIRDSEGSIIGIAEDDTYNNVKLGIKINDSIVGVNDW